MEHLIIPAEIRAQAAVAAAVCYTLPSGQAYIVVQQADVYHAFVNLCPHRRFRLDRNGQLSLTADQQLLVCRNHGARFDLHSGQCVSGPCVGKALQPVTVRVE
jgi:nitrite reductase/ring-hydroxylating ferredoxin subunit